MNQAEVQLELAALENVAKFSAMSKIPLRTLHRIRNGEGPSNSTTLMLVAQALKRIKPAKKETA